MKNPLTRRLPREFKGDLGKYVVIFLFMTMLVMLVSGFLVADGSMSYAYEESFEKYNVEHGHLVFDKTPPEKLLSDIEEKAGIKLYDLRYFEEDSDDSGKTSRVYILRKDVDIQCLMSGELPTADDEIAIDRMYAANNDLKVGDIIVLNGRTLKISGLVALTDYSCLYEKNSDMLFDAINFNVGVMTEEGFNKVDSHHVFYCYAWKYNCDYDKNDKPAASDLSEKVLSTLEDVLTEYDEAIITAQTDAIKEKLEKAGAEYAEKYMQTGKEPSKEELSVKLDDFLFDIVKDSVSAQLTGEEYKMPDEKEFEKEIDKTDIITVKDYVPAFLNQAINFTGEDMGGDKAFVIVFNYVVIAILAFIFAITTSNTLVAEAGVIGTLRASGYSRAELICHYLILPSVITLIAAAIGNILGYTVFKDVMADFYYGSYSLVTFEVQWNAEAFILTTVIPLILMIVINFSMIYSKMKLSPLRFLRRDLKKRGRKKAFRLNTKIPFSIRFRLRIIFQNMPNYCVMVFGIMLGALIIIFGDMFGNMFRAYSDILTESMICDYQYILSEPAETSSEKAEKYCLSSYDFTYKDYVADSISVYGIIDGSSYVGADVKDGKTAVSSTIAAKYHMSEGDSITLVDPFSRNTTYTFTIDSIYDYETSLAVFISSDRFCDMFGYEDGHYSGYFSNEKLTDIDNKYIAGILTASDYTKLCDQMEVSMGSFMEYFGYFGTIMFILVMYILSKQVIERNFQSISMCKILGFKNSEIGGLYIVSTSVSAIIGLIVSIPVTEWVLNIVFESYLYKVAKGYIPCIIDRGCYVKMMIIGIIAYAAVSVLQMIKINRIPKSEALKNVE